jgi:hypothetical protein
MTLPPLHRAILNGAGHPICHAHRTGVGLFVPKPSRGADCQSGCVRDLGKTVRLCPPTSMADHGDCSHFVTRYRLPLAQESQEVGHLVLSEVFDQRISRRLVTAIVRLAWTRIKPAARAGIQAAARPT